ncbi:ribosome maturation factor RimM [Lichenihabitans psoromatis]|uniref:ribosome maturation factor RimM n=1 Tax=Lichenihabitans psoromatis TaxID=2528642 RepID=UPI0010384D3A|nr:ribosome maturation factor RimM [Lichenihabitans psoromatis]
MASQQRILVGVVGAPHGIRGEVRVKSYTATPTAIASYRPLTSEDGRKTLVMLGLRPVKDDMVVARFENVGTREAAAALTNMKLYVDRAILPAADEDEFYHADLVGLRAETSRGEPLGEVMSLANYGAGDLLEIRPPAGETILVPFTKAFVPVVDVPGGRVTISDDALAEADPDAEAASADAPQDDADR